jgi:hypothetical protein
MKKFSWLIPVILIVAYCCSPVKKVKKDPAKTMQVVNWWLSENPIQPDTAWAFKPGDTITTFDTIYSPSLQWDTVPVTIGRVYSIASNTIDSVMPTRDRIITKTIRIRDTVRVTITDTRLLGAMQTQLKTSQGDLAAQKLATEKADVRADRWKLKFWASWILLGVGVVILFLLKMRP